jgi:hypothetical protein
VTQKRRVAPHSHPLGNGRSRPFRRFHDLRRTRLLAIHCNNEMPVDPFSWPKPLPPWQLSRSAVGVFWLQGYLRNTNIDQGAAKSTVHRRQTHIATRELPAPQRTPCARRPPNGSLSHAACLPWGRDLPHSLALANAAGAAGCSRAKAPAAPRHTVRVPLAASEDCRPRKAGVQPVSPHSERRGDPCLPENPSHDAARDGRLSTRCLARPTPGASARCRFQRRDQHPGAAQTTHVTVVRFPSPGSI